MSLSALATRRVAATLLAVLLASTGCGDDGSAVETPPDSAATATGGATSSDGDGTDTTGQPANSTLPDPCALLTVDELRDITGQPFTDGAPTATPLPDDAVACDWYSDDPYATAQVLIIAGGDASAQRASVEEAFDEPTQPLDLTVDAYRTQDGSLVGLQVGADFVQVSYIPPGPGDVSTQTVALAELVLGRL